MWKLSHTKSGHPQMRFKDGGSALTRRVSYALSGRTLRKGKPIITECEEKSCVNPEHLVMSTIRAVAIKASKTGYQGRIDSKIRNANSRRSSSQAKLTMEKAIYIRNSERTAADLAVEFGVNQSLISKIKRGEVWKEYSTMFGQLIKGG